MEKKKSSPILTIAAICLVTLAVFSLIGGLAYPRSATMVLTAFIRQGVNSQQFTPPTGQGGTFNNGGPGTFNRGNFSGTPQAGEPGQFIPNGQNGIIPNGQFANRAASPFSWVLTLGLGLFVLLAIITAIFLVKKKKWAGILALFLVFLTLILNALAIYSEFGISRMIGARTQGSLVFTIIETALAIAIIVLLLLPKGRALWAVKAPKPTIDDDDDFDDDDDDNDSDEVIQTDQASKTSADAAKFQPQITDKQTDPKKAPNLKLPSRLSGEMEDDDDSE